MSVGVYTFLIIKHRQVNFPNKGLQEHSERNSVYLIWKRKRVGKRIVDYWKGNDPNEEPLLNSNVTGNVLKNSKIQRP